MPSIFARPLMNFSSIRVFASLRAGSQEASHATVATRRGAFRLPSLTSVFNQAKEIPKHCGSPQKSRIYYYKNTIAAKIIARKILYNANGTNLIFEISFKKNRIEMSENTKALRNPTI